ncbi:unnamed protein product [Boreogadus saida]
MVEDAGNSTDHFWWERQPQTTPKPDNDAAGDDAAGDDAAGDDAAGDDAAGDEAAGDDAAGDDPRNEPRRQQKQPCCAPDRRPSERPPEASAKGGEMCVWQPGLVEKQGLNSPLLHSFVSLPALELLHGETGPRYSTLMELKLWWRWLVVVVVVAGVVAVEVAVVVAVEVAVVVAVVVVVGGGINSALDDTISFCKVRWSAATQ